jgi:general secretion pathway protein L
MVASSIQYQLREFFSWWGDELAAMMPDSVVSLFQNGRPLKLHYADQAVHLANHGRTGEEVHENFYDGIDFENEEQLRILGAASEIRLCLEKKKYLIKRVTLPIETEENQREVLSFEMDRQTPFTPDQVYYDYVINERDKKSRTLDVTLVLAPIDRLNYALELLARHKVSINAISPCEEDIGTFNRVNLLPLEKRRKPQKAYRLVNYFLMLTVMLLLLANLALPVWQKSGYAQSLDEQLSVSRRASAEAVALSGKLEQAELENRFLENKKREALPLTKIINELTLVIPDDTWISNFESREGVVHLHGQSVASAALIPLIDASPLFRKVSFRSPVTQNRQNNTERFHISAELVINEEPRQ